MQPAPTPTQLDSSSALSFASPPRKLAAQGKTLVGVKISSTGGGLSLQRVRHPALHAKAATTAKMTGRLVCRSLGITRDVEDITTATLDTFAKKFKEELTPEVILDMREFFELDNFHVSIVDETLLSHGGDGVLDTVGVEEELIV
ncbi:hypothetical protein D1007_35394 [Hordeum vulgare]|nr:hypothetical protein D1007_35394 [Hordeum vulgare]